jgi:methionyl-tRNA formyltransferase
MGTPDFASGILEALIQDKRNEIVGVVTATDKAQGRGMQIQKSSVSLMAEKHNVLVLKPEKLRDIQFSERLQSLQADIFVVVAFRMLPEGIWKMPPKGTINLHASLLPQYRGAAPIQWAIINGETQTGVTTFFINEKIDEGNILLWEKVPILPQDNAASLHDKLLNVGKEVLLKTVYQIETGTYQEYKQPEQTVIKPAPKLFKQDCLIDWNLPAVRIYNFIRGLSPYPTAFSRYQDKDGGEAMLKIFACEAGKAQHNLPAGMVETDNRNFLKIACPDGYIYVKEMQVVGKKRINIRDFLLGNKNFGGILLY